MTTTDKSEFYFVVAERLGTTLVAHTSLSGGDISSVHLLETTDHRFVVKSNTDELAPDMFEQEAVALKAIAATKTVATPRVRLLGHESGNAFLVMDYIESKQPSSSDFDKLGSQIAQMHTVNHSSFGWSQNNYIGSLPQLNEQHTDWPIFYVHGRLVPQLALALEKSLLSREDVPSRERLLDRAKEILSSKTPVLLHGDLWSGNFLIATDGTPYVIDPAIYYGHGEIDLAMSRLFGGFDGAFYTAYHTVHQPEEGLARRQDWYQLYYLLVHLNLFGVSYLEPVKKILKPYF